MQSVAKGDKEAFRTLALIYQKPLYSFCLKTMQGHESFADDIVQQTLITWWQKAPLWKPYKGQLSAWVFTIAVNKCKDYMKRQHAAYALHESDAVTETSDSNTLQKKQRLFILQAMDNLNERQKTIVTLFYFAELSQKEIAKKLYMTLKNVEMNLYRSKKIMRSKLKDKKDALL